MTTTAGFKTLLPKPLATWLAWVLPALLTAVAYAAAGRLALALAIPPGIASPLYPSAGLALAAALVYGPRVLPGIVVGALSVQLMFDQPSHLPALSLLAVVLVPALGAMLQAHLGAFMIKRFLPGPLVLGEPREVALFCLLAGVLTCACNACLSTLTLSLTGVVPPESRLFTWWTWWSGDTLGVLIGAPIVLTLIGRPQSAWVGRRVTVGLPLLATTALLALATILVSRWDTQRSRSVFERDASATSAAVQSRLAQSIFALKATQGLFLGSEGVSPEEMQRASRSWLDLPIQIQVIGYSERVARSQVQRYQAKVSQQRGAPYVVREDRSPQDPVIAAQDTDMVLVRYVEPLATNAAALGINSLAIPAARDAIRQAILTGEPMVTNGFRLAQEPGNQVGVVIYQALYDESPQGVDHARAFRGVVFVGLRMQQTIQSVLRDAPPYLDWCLLETRPGGARQRLAGATGCETTQADAMHHEATIDLGGKKWLLTLDAGRSQVPDAGYGNAWLFSTVGMLAAALLAALLLTMTGRTRRIEEVVAERTADLRREVIERERTASALRESEQRFRNIFDHAPIGIVYADLHGHMRDANPRLREMLGYSSEQLAERSLTDLAHPDDHAQDDAILAPILSGQQQEVRRRMRLQHHDGHLLWVQMNWSVLHDLTGQPQRLVAVVEDITEYLRRQEAEQGRHLAESANQAKNEFLSRMSHELRTPLNAMLGFAQLLELDRTQQLSDQQRNWVMQILQAGWHLLEMINDTLDLSRIEAGMLRLEPTTVALPPLLTHCLSMVAASAQQHNIRLEQHIAADAQQALADETRLKQVLTNLLSNAVKYNVPGGRVVVSTSRLDDRRVQISVLDTGLGLSDAQMAGLFQPFNRLGRENGQTEGTGIGLVISRGLAELMGGTLQAHSVQGQGATFVLTLPQAPQAPPTAGQVLHPAAVAAVRTQKRVHYIEDNETNVEVMRGMLAQRPQWALDVSTLGWPGLAAMRRQVPDLILLDLHLPDADGLALLAEIRRDPQLCKVPVVVVSADATTTRTAEALAAGANHYLTKPLNLGSFLAVIDEVLAPSNGA